jgi:hypothetical protein
MAPCGHLGHLMGLPSPEQIHPRTRHLTTSRRLRTRSASSKLAVNYCTIQRQQPNDGVRMSHVPRPTSNIQQNVGSGQGMAKECFGPSTAAANQGRANQPLPAGPIRFETEARARLAPRRRTERCPRSTLQLAEPDRNPLLGPGSSVRLEPRLPGLNPPSKSQKEPRQTGHSDSNITRCSSSSCIGLGNIPRRHVVPADRMRQTATEKLEGG